MRTSPSPLPPLTCSACCSSLSSSVSFSVALVYPSCLRCVWWWYVCLWYCRSHLHLPFALLTRNSPRRIDTNNNNNNNDNHKGNRRNEAIRRVYGWTGGYGISTKRRHDPRVWVDGWGLLGCWCRRDCGSAIRRCCVVARGQCSRSQWIVLVASNLVEW